jgi:predicted transcriptional regulator with HTH domain
MPVVRTVEDDGKPIEGPQFGLDKGYTGESSVITYGLISVARFYNTQQVSGSLCDK